MLETHPFGNFIPSNIKYLLLGSFIAKTTNSDPQYDWFYCSIRNQFWPIIEQVYNINLPNKASKIELFTKLEIGIADIIYQCERKNSNSSDTNLVSIVYNPELRNILSSNKIRIIFFSSKYVENLYRKIFKDFIQEFTNIKLICLPSPSPRYALLSKEAKIARYRNLLPKIQTCG